MNLIPPDAFAETPAGGVGATGPHDDGGDHPVLPWLTARRRGWFYRVATPLGALLGSYGVIEEHKVALWIAVGIAIVSPGLAAAHTPVKE